MRLPALEQQLLFLGHFLCPSHCANKYFVLAHSHEPSLQNKSIGAIVIPILWMRKLRLSDIKLMSTQLM